MNYYPFHIGDYLSATRHLSWSEDAAYRRLLDTYYTTEKPLPLDLRAVCRLVLATTDEQREAVQVVLEEFFARTDDGWVNSRADDEIAAMREKQQKQRDKANKRWHKPETEPGIASAMPRHKETDATASKTDADAMPPTPTPTPTPKNKEEAQAPLPDWVPVEAWNGYAEMRKKIRKPMTTRAQALVLKTLDRIRESGYSVEECLDNSTRNGWIDVYEPKAMAATAAGPKRGSEEYAALHKSAGWWRDAGFDSVWSAMSAKCWHNTAHQFRDGKRVEVAA
jgi:uncharacterized protein YdaU (DUF1376 family)